MASWTHVRYVSDSVCWPSQKFRSSIRLLIALTARIPPSSFIASTLLKVTRDTAMTRVRVSHKKAYAAQTHHDGTVFASTSVGVALVCVLPFDLDDHLTGILKRDK
ncbi:hypothetical protein CERZMDRAFT_93081 [Cercospora zeae-maydis SCOH1-5]|uniref:Uncharacterized protein n=1 Tax=Cercospora zeae-maydis SCOH1-5 TaxID=717836 RepID=A0A6A6FUX0_9PEZI|nr:hypothetical protein CERZMDRAFT_93081 [Cercospora zeae-maydis SCOH1-5]